MSRTFTVALAAASVSLLAACGSTESEQETVHVPDGVTEQHEVLAEELAEKGQTSKSGDWTINLITEAAEPWHVVKADGTHAFREPAAGETNHIEIIPVETSTGRIVPDVPITVEVMDASGKSVQKLELNFYWATFMHYANNFSIPQASTYTLRVTVGVPTFPRHGEEHHAPSMTEGASVEFSDVELG